MEVIYSKWLAENRLLNTVDLKTQFSEARGQRVRSATLPCGKKDCFRSREKRSELPQTLSRAPDRNRGFPFYKLEK